MHRYQSATSMPMHYLYTKKQPDEFVRRRVWILLNAIIAAIGLLIMNYKIIGKLNLEKIINYIIVVIIAIIVIRVYPVFRDAKEKARLCGCEWNLKDLLSATSIYAQDYDGKLPPKNKWTDCIKSRIGSEYKLKCPTDKNADKSRCSYSFNSKLGSSTFSQLKSQPTTPIYFDSKGGWNSLCPLTGAVKRHLGGANYGFADGHVKWKRLD